MLDNSIMESIAMQIILDAGDARNLARNALKEMRKDHCEQADELLLQAKEYIEKAHIAQTEFIQDSLAQEDPVIPDLLFVHAQDTLMTIRSEVNMACEFVETYKVLSDKLKK